MLPAKGWPSTEIFQGSCTATCPVPFSLAALSSQKMGMAPVLLRVAPFANWSLFHNLASQPGYLPFSLGEFHLKANYPTKSPLEDVLRLVAMGSDEFVTERYAFEIEQELEAMEYLTHPSCSRSQFTRKAA